MEEKAALAAVGGDLRERGSVFKAMGEMKKKIQLVEGKRGHKQSQLATNTITRNTNNVVGSIYLMYCVLRGHRWSLLL